MAVRQFAGGSFDEAIRLSTEWQRHEMKFTPNQRWCYVLAGPDLIERSGKAPPPKQATVWLDGVQLEQATGATDFHPRQPVVAVVWAPNGVNAGPISLTNPDLALLDLMGRPQSQRQFTPGETPIYVIGERVTAEQLRTGIAPGN